MQCYMCCIVHLCTFALSAASPFSVSRFLETYEDEFLEVVNPKLSLLKLKHKEVILADVRTAIESANDEDASISCWDTCRDMPL